MANPHGWRILLDENIPFRLKYDLRAAGFPTVHATDVGLKGSSDDVVYAYAARNDLIVVTSDKGFHPPYAQFPSTHAGIILSRLGTGKHLRSELLAAIINLASQLQDMHSHIFAVEQNGVCMQTV